MIFWTLFIPFTALFFIVYFRYIDVLFRGRKQPYLIRDTAEHAIPKREIYSTIINLFIFAGAGFLVGWIIDSGHSFVYTDRPTTFYDFLLLPISFFASLGIHDLYFYLTHRLLHVGFIFRHIHADHHKSHEVSPWSAFSFHPIEAVVQIAVVVLITLILPMHFGVLIAFTVMLSLISVYGHCGYELRLNKLEAFNVFNTSLHHYQHHKEVRYNFGIYLNVWDKLFKTESPNYSKSIDLLKEKVSKRLKLSSTTRPNRDR